MIRIKKIKINQKDAKIEIDWRIKKSQSSDDEMSMKCADQARPQFYQSLQKMAGHWSDILELQDFDVKPTVSSVSFSWAEDDEGLAVMGMTIYGSCQLSKSTGVWGCNTPHRIEKHYGKDGDEGQIMSDDMIDDAYALLSEAERYINGEREQLSLFDQKAA
jgi:hypothetical protein